MEARGHLSASEPQIFIACRLCSQYFMDLICPRGSPVYLIPLKAHLKERTRYTTVSPSIPNHTAHMDTGWKARECGDLEALGLLFRTCRQAPRCGLLPISAFTLSLPSPHQPKGVHLPGCPGNLVSFSSLSPPGSSSGLSPHCSHLAPWSNHLQGFWPPKGDSG